MKTQIIEQVEFFSEAELESLEFVPEELEAIEAERVPDLDSISFEEVAKHLEAYFEGDVEQAGLEARGGKNKQARKGMGFYRKVNTQFQWNNVPHQVRTKVNEIALTQQPAQNKARFTDSAIHSYWRTGNYRIFGNLVPRGGFNFVGYGTHQGKTNNKYSVTLPNGSTVAQNR